MKASGFRPELIATMRRSRITDHKIDEYREQFLAITPRKAEQQMATQKRRLQDIASTREALEARESRATWPEPSDIAKLEALEYSARRVQKRVIDTRIDLSLKGMKEDMKAEERPPWWAVPAGAARLLDEDSMIRWFEDSGPLVPGKYDIYVRQGDDQEPQIPLAVCLAHGVQVEEGKPSKVLLQTGLRLELAKGSLKPLSWFVLACDASSTAIVSGRTGESPAPLWLLPGKYDVYWIQSLEHRKKPLLLARAVEVKENEVAAVPVRYSAIMLESASWIPKRDQNHGWWGVVQTGDKPSYVVQRTVSEDKVVVPIGQYDVYWVQGLDQNDYPMLIAKGMEVKENQFAIVPAKSGIQLKPPKGAPALDANYGWWGVAPAGGKHEERINWSTGKFDQALFVPPGTYDIFWKQNLNHDPERIKRGVVVKENLLLVVEAQPPKATVHK